MDALFGEPRLAAIYDLVEGGRRGDLDHYLAIVAELGPNLKHRVEVVADADGMAGVVAAEAATKPR